MYWKKQETNAARARYSNHSRRALYKGKRHAEMRVNIQIFNSSPLCGVFKS